MSDAAVLHVSHLYFKRRLSKQEIATRLGISRFKVARLLDRALEEGIVRIEVREPVPLDEDAGRRLELGFGIELALVVRGDSPDDLARVAAAWLPDLVKPGDVLGVAWGSTVQRVVRALERAPAVPVVQICGAIGGLEAGEGPLEVAWQLAERLGGPFYPLPIPALVEPTDEILRNEAIAPTVAMFEHVSLALVGIGAPGASSLLGSGIVPDEAVPESTAGDLLCHFFDSEGRILPGPSAVQLSVEQLRKARVMAVAGGAAKRHAIVSALRTGLIDVLVTNEAGLL